MVDQTQVDNGYVESPPRTVARNTAELMSDVFTLAELQGRLLLIDLEAGIWRIVPLVVTLLTGVVLAVSCLPIALAAIALALVELAELSPAQAFAIALLAGAVSSLALIAAAAWQLKTGLRLFARSQFEWNQNLRWIKSTLARMGKSSNSAGGKSSRHELEGV